MFERFTERARQVVILAKEEARNLRHNYIGTEHVLLGILREEEGLGARTLDTFDGVGVERVRVAVTRIIGTGDEAVGEQIPFTPRAKKVLELALREALSLGHNYIGTEHILLGLIREGEGVAMRILYDLIPQEERGVSGSVAEEIRNRVIQTLAGPGGRRERDDSPEQIQKDLETAEAAKNQAIEDREFEKAAQHRDVARRLTVRLRELQGHKELDRPLLWYLDVSYHGPDGTTLIDTLGGWEQRPSMYIDQDAYRFVSVSDRAGEPMVIVPITDKIAIEMRKKEKIEDA